MGPIHFIWFLNRLSYISCGIQDWVLQGPCEADRLGWVKGHRPECSEPTRGRNTTTSTCLRTNKSGSKEQMNVERFSNSGLSTLA